MKEVDDGEAGRSVYVLQRRLGNPANLSLTSTSPTLLLLLLIPHPLNELPRTQAARSRVSVVYWKAEPFPPLHFVPVFVDSFLGLPPRSYP